MFIIDNNICTVGIKCQPSDGIVDRSEEGVQLVCVAAERKAINRSLMARCRWRRDIELRRTAILRREKVRLYLRPLFGGCVCLGANSSSWIISASSLRYAKKVAATTESCFPAG